MGVRLRVDDSRSPLLQQPSCFFAVLLVFSCTALTCNGLPFHATPQVAIESASYQQSDLDALQVLWGAWNTSTPNLDSNLAGWNSSQPDPCSDQISLNQNPNWRGVQCLMSVACTTNMTTGYTNCSSFIVGLTLNNASIVGILPQDIGNISTLTTLQLTGNPNLTGYLPASLGKTNLYTLDLHDNGFQGEIPDFGYFQWPLTLDLSGNQLNGSFPQSQISTMVKLQTLKLGRNNFEGPIPESAFVNMPQLVQLDLSSNRFNGIPPNLSMINNLQILDLSNNNFIGTVPNLTMMDSLINLDMSGNKFSGRLPDVSKMKFLSTLNLSRNAYTGSIYSSEFFSLADNSNLSVLDLSHNQLTTDLNSWNNSELGSLQELYLDYNAIQGTLDITRLFTLGFLNTKSTNYSTASSGKLRVLSLKNNNISNVVYDASIIEYSTTNFRLEGNPYCNSNDGTAFRQQVCSTNSVPVNTDKSKVVIIAVVTSVTSVLLMIGLAATIFRHKRYKRYLQLQLQQKFEEFEVKPTIFPYSQLRTATRDFHSDMKLGEGAFGAVYKGVLPNGHVVAVKQLFAKTSQGIDEFLNEVVLLTGMKHRNLVNLKGCCIREQQRILVYEYVDNYDMDQVLLLGPNKALVSWSVRLKICLGIARGLHYLHALAHPRIIHRDIKASNILLTKNYESKIADFGLASLFPDEESYILTQHVAGTKGYLAPEYASYGQLSDKVDVFSFGVLCLEVVTGRRNINKKLPPDEIYLPNWAWELHRQGRLIDLVDPTLSLQDDEKLEVQRLITVALLCTQMTAEQRPSMERVVAMLQGDSESEALALNSDNEEQGLNTMRMFAFGENGLATVKGEGESPDMESLFMESSRRAAGLSEKSSSGFAALVELNEIRSVK